MNWTRSTLFLPRNSVNKNLPDVSVHTSRPPDMLAMLRWRLVFFRLRLNIKFSIANPFHYFRITMVKETTRL